MLLVNMSVCSSSWPDVMWTFVCGGKSENALGAMRSGNK